MSSPSDDPRSPQIRRQPTGPIPRAQPVPGDTGTHLIRRVPLGQQEASTTLIPGPADTPASGRTAFAASAAAMLSGWPTAVVATDLISGWWNTDRLFCLAVGFLTLVFAAATVCGVILLLRRRAVGRYLTASGAGLALLTFGSVFLAGAQVAWPVYLIPMLPLTSLVLSLLPATGRWCSEV